MLPWRSCSLRFSGTDLPWLVSTDASGEPPGPFGLRFAGGTGGALAFMRSLLHIKPIPNCAREFQSRIGGGSGDLDSVGARRGCTECSMRLTTRRARGTFSHAGAARLVAWSGEAASPGLSFAFRRD